MNVFTCTPVAFEGGPDFFTRDSGLLSKGFQSHGHSCKAVMPLPANQQDLRENLIRTEPANLENEHWWRGLSPDLVVLYAWGSPRYRHVARAIRRAGAFLILNQDNGGWISPLAGLGPWFREQWILGGQGKNLQSWFRFLQLVVCKASYGLAVTDPLRAEHLSYGHVIACVSPSAAICYRRLCRIYRDEELALKVRVIPHAVESRFTFVEGAKQRKVVCVGRWEDVLQKRTALMCSVISRLLGRDRQVIASIAGKVTSELSQWRDSLPDSVRDRVLLLGKIDRQQLADLLHEGQVFYSPSAFESFGIAAAEALCSGCSVVAQKSVSMASFEWFVSTNSGFLAKSDDAEAHVEALISELTSWNRGERDAAHISSIWRDQFHADKVAARILNVMAQTAVRHSDPAIGLGMHG